MVKQSTTIKRSAFFRVKLIAGILFLLLLAAGATVYYLATYRLKNSIRYAVDKASEGRYAFDANTVKLSLWDKTFSLTQATLQCRDTTHVNAHYDVSVKEIYFSISSIRDLLFNKKIMIDSLLVLEPDIKVYMHSGKLQEKKKSAFHTSEIIKYLQTALKKFNAHSLTVQDAAFTYSMYGNNQPFHADHINIHFENFCEIQESDDHILASDNVTFSLGRQDWILPGGGREIHFKGLSFNGRGQHFELDSFSFYRKATAEACEMQVKANKFFFNSRHLPAIYMRNELLIDSLVCVDPEIILSAPGKKQFKKRDSLAIKNDLFKRINIKYIDIQNGTVVLKDKNGRNENAATHRSNLNVYNLTLNPGQEKPFSADSINADLSKLRFLSPDSLFQLEIDKFSFRQNTVIFRNVDFSPTAYKGADKGIHFSAPLLLVKNINIEDLMRKRITATEAELVRPVISFVNSRRKRKAPAKAPVAGTNKMDLVYKSLNGLSELVNVERFKMIDGEARFSMNGGQPLDVSVSKLNALILLNQLFVSDSLIDVKHAMPDVRFASADIKTPKMKIELDSYRFDGTLRHNWGNGLSIITSDGMRLKGKGIYWEVFDWDIFEETGDIQIDLLSIDQLDMQSAGSKKEAGSAVPAKELPVIRIGELKAGKVDFTGKGASDIHLSAKNFYADSIRSVRHFFTWNTAFANIYDVTFKNNGTNANIKEIAFNNQKETVLNDILYESDNAKGHTSIRVPSIQLETRLHSTEAGHIILPSIKVNQPAIEIVSHKYVTNSKNKNTVKTAPVFTIDNIDIHQGTLSYTSYSKKDTLQATASASFSAKGITWQSSGYPLLQFDGIQAGLTDIRFTRKQLSIELPSASFTLRNGKAGSQKGEPIYISTAIDIAWQQAAINYAKDSTELRVKNLSGSFREPLLSISKTKKILWRSLVHKTTVGEASVLYQNKNIKAAAENYSWNPGTNRMMISRFSVIPVKSRDLAFSTAPWQGDYMIIKGDRLILSGISVVHKPGDTLIWVQNIIAGNIDLNTSRDKHMPFHHGIEKPMPTKLIAGIRMPVRVDTVSIQHSNITYNERSVATGKWSTVPLKDINGYLLNITNRPALNDSLQVFATTRLLDNHIRHFSYVESYKDSLSYFRAQSNLAPTQLPGFSSVSMPMAAVSITKGLADTMYAYWEGNKYAAFGSMNFFYRDLKIKVHNKNDKKKSGLKESFETFLVNLILPDTKKRPSAIFVERDSEKFIFNYWVKAHTRGLLSTVGVKGNNKYRKSYLQKQDQYSLPRKTMEELKRP